MKTIYKKIVFALLLMVTQHTHAADSDMMLCQRNQMVSIAYSFFAGVAAIAGMVCHEVGVPRARNICCSLSLSLVGLSCLQLINSNPDFH